MTTRIILQAAASSVLLAGVAPAYTCENVITRPEFHFSNLVFNQADDQLNYLAPDEDTVEAESFLDQLITKHSLDDLMPKSRAWVAEEFYSAEETIASLRLKAGLTQNQLARKLGMPQSSVARLESGRESPTLERAKRVADALDVSLDAFYSAFEATRTAQLT